MGSLPAREGARLRCEAMQLLMKVSRAVAVSFLASALPLQLRMRCCTFLETGVAGTTSRGGVAVTAWVAGVVGSAGPLLFAWQRWGRRWPSVQGMLPL